MRVNMKSSRRIIFMFVTGVVFLSVACSSIMSIKKNAEAESYETPIIAAYFTAEGNLAFVAKVNRNGEIEQRLDRMPVDKIIGQELRSGFTKILVFKTKENPCYQNVNADGYNFRVEVPCP